MTGHVAERVSTARQLADRFWEQLLELDPILGTQVGDERFDDRLPDPSAAGVARRASVYRGVLDEMGGIDRAALGVEDRTALDVAEAIARSGLDAITYRLDRFRAVSHLFGPAQLLAELGSLQRADTAERAERYLARLAAVPTYLAAVSEVAREGAASGSTAPALVVDRAIGQVERLLAGDPATSPGMSPFPAGMAETEAGRQAAAALMEEAIWPAYAGYLAALRAYRPAARETIGAGDLPDGPALYASQILAHTTLPLTAEEVHATGLAELAAIQEEEREIAGRLGHPDAASALAAHTAAGGNVAGTRAELLARAERQVAQAWDAASGWFGRLPASPCQVSPVEAFREEDMPPAFYIPATGDGSRPGIYYINLGHLDAVPLHMLATISYHEANPGHHFQISIEQEFTERGPLRRFGGIQAGTAFAEGWGLYCERLAGEMGLYESDYERLGMLGAQAWRAVRLIVDSGIHALGWDRQRAVDLCTSVGLARPVAEVEVDRYISWPGQALSYKIGQIEIQSLRAEAARRPGFSVRAFHDRLLELGTLPLAALRREMSSV
ncbi:MAG TPA: DUF885 domain-containing protein [Actinomycetota bacterium]|nr:DUF885 domain-containing protein [Actinomycetota bacterium]